MGNAMTEAHRDEPMVVRDCLKPDTTTRIEPPTTWTGGEKYDEGKPRYDLVPPDAFEEIVKVLTFGASKYADRNWEKGISYGRVFGAAMRHLWSWWRHDDIDAETGLSHLAHAGCCILFLLAFEQRNMDHCDDR